MRYDQRRTTTGQETDLQTWEWGLAGIRKYSWGPNVDVMAKYCLYQNSIQTKTSLLKVLLALVLGCVTIKDGKH